jgi:hypothetical protein
VAQGLERIDDVLCAEWAEVFNDISNLGITTLPNGQVSKVVGQAIQAAKTFAENGLDAAELFDVWVRNVCGTPDWDIELWMALVDAPDSVGTSVECLREDQSKCQKQDVLSSTPATSSGTRMMEGKMWFMYNSKDPKGPGRARDIRKVSSLIGALIWMSSVHSWSFAIFLCIIMGGMRSDMSPFTPHVSLSVHQ